MILLKKFCEFHSALNKVDEVTGRFDEEKFRKLILPLRGQVMSVDGMNGCHITRYALEVEFFEDIISGPEVEQHIQKVIAWAEGQPDFFPFAKEAKKTVIINMHDGRRC